MPGPPGYLVVANGAAGSTEEPVVREVAGRLAERGPASVAWTEDEDDFDAALAGLDGRRLVVVGGDGTLHFALNRLAVTDRLDEVVGLVPAGTGNDFARGAGLGTDLARSVEIVLADAARWFATIELEEPGEPDQAGPGVGTLAHNNVHFGLGLVAAERGSAWKPRLGRFAYPVATVVEGLGYPGAAMAVRHGDESLFEGDALAVLVLLGPSMGGGIELVDDVALDEPVLDVVVIEPPTRAGRVALAADALRDRLVARDDVHRWALDSVTVTVAGGPQASDPVGELRGDVDGEISSWPGSVGLRVRPRTWQVLAPPIAD